MSISAMRQASDAILNVLAGGEFDNPVCDLKQAALALQQAIAEAEKREWVWLTKEEVDSWELPDRPTVFEFVQFIEAKVKEKREWVGLTDEEKGWCAAPTYEETIERVEAKLKEKNT